MTERSRFGRLFDAKPSDIEFKIESNGHDTWRIKHTHFDTEIGALMTLDEASDSDIERIIQAWEDNKPLDEPVPYEVSSLLYGCGYCKEAEFVFDGFTCKAVNPCPYPNGFEKITVELEVPSGQLVIGNDFRDVFSVKEDDFYVNEPSEIKRCVEAYANEAKMLHFFVGNTCPGVYQTGDDQFTIATGDPDEVDNPIIGNKVAWVCTDLWWVCIVDKDEADRRGLKYATGRWTENELVPVTPGTYVLEYYALSKSFDRDDYSKPIVFAKLYKK